MGIGNNPDNLRTEPMFSLPSQLEEKMFKEIIIMRRTMNEMKEALALIQALTEDSVRILSTNITGQEEYPKR